MSEEEINNFIYLLEIKHIDSKPFLDILDKYNKEKEKNKKLIEGQVETIEKIIQPELFKKYISKDKLRDKQMYYEKMLKEENWGEKTELGIRNRIVAIEELLEE